MRFIRMKRIYFLAAVFGVLRGALANDGAIFDQISLFEPLRPQPSVGVDLRSGQRVTLALREGAEPSRDFADIEAIEGRARRGLDDTAAITADPKPAFKAQSIPALTAPTTTASHLTKAASAQTAAANAGPNWVAIGPSPIPNGQTDPANANGISITQSPVSGRTTAIAIDPTNPAIAYVGTAQGGLYRTLNGGADWTPLLDNALGLAVGSVKVDPKDPTKVIVGTGEGNFSGDSYVGVGVYLITGANGSSPTLNGPYNIGTDGKDVMTNRCAVSIAIDNQNDNNVFVGTVTGVVGLFGVIPGNVPRRGLFRSKNFMSGSPTFEKLAVLGEDTTTAASDYRVTAVVVDPSDANNLVLAIASSDGAAPQGFYRSTNALATSPTFTKVLDTSDSDIAPARMAIQRDASTGIVTIVAATGQHNGDTPITSFNQGKVWKSINGGATWVELIGARGFAGGQGFYNIGIDIDRLNPNNIYVVGTLSAHDPAGQVDTGDNGTFIYSRDGGLTWKASVNTLHVDSHAVAVAPSNPAVIYTGNDGGIWKSVDAGLNWLNANTAGFLATQFSGLAVHPIDRNFTLGGTQDNGTELRLPNGTWKRADFGDGGFALIDQTAGDTESVTMYHTYFNAALALEGYSRVLKASCATEGQWAFRGAAVALLLPGLPIPLPAVGSTVCDGSAGQTANGQSAADDVNFYAPMALGPSNATLTGFNTVYYGSDKLYESLDQGEHMIAQSQVLEPSGAPIVPDGRPVGVPATPGTNTPISAIGISPQDDNVRLVGTNSGRVWTTSTGGPLVNVTDPAMPVQPVARAAIDPTDVNVAYVSYVGSGFGGKNHVWKTTNLTDATPVWTAIGNGLPDVSANALVIDPLNHNDLYVGTDRGVFNSPDGGTTWTAYGNGLPNVAVFDLAIQKKFGILRAATHGKGMYEISLGLARLRNISTRAFVQTGDGVAIGGFIITGSGGKRVLIRAIGPSLSGLGIGGTLADPTLELRDASNALITSNDNWTDSPDAAAIQATGIPPSNGSESAIIRTLNPGSYTAIVAGKDGGTGIGLVEIYDVDDTIEPKLANIATRAFVQTGDNVMIGGFIVGGGTGVNTRVVVRGIGPSLAGSVPNPLQNPTLELRDANAALLQSNDDWRSNQETEISGTGLAPSNNAEAAILATVTPGSYTAILRGKDGTTGTAVVEIYDVGP